MRICLHLAALVLLVPGASAARPADAADRPMDRPAGTRVFEPARGDSFVSVITQPTGEPILAIRYPWKRHAKPSIELRILREGEVDNPLIRPLFFRHNIMKGGVTKAVYQCQDDSEDTAQTATFSQDNADFRVLGARNSLGRPAVCVACRINPDEISQKTESLISELARTGQESALSRRFVAETRAAYCLLDAWAVDERTLYLELPAEEFSQQSEIRVWFLRDKEIVWRADTTWPGTPQ